MSDVSDRDLESLAEELEALRKQNERLTERVETLEDDLDRTTDRVDDLERNVTTLETCTTTLEAKTETLETETATLHHKNDCLETLETETTQNAAAIEAAHRRSGANKARLEELQARELEKGAHLLETNVDRHEIDVDGDRLEKIQKDDRAYYRLPDADDPLDRSDVTVAHGDLLPIQQLARMDEDMLRSTTNALPSRLAAKLWKARTDPSTGDDPWNDGCKNVKEYVKASDLKHWIRRQEPGTSDAYAKKLVSRTIDALLDLSKNRLAIRRKRERKNGLEYTERRVLLTTEAEIPGETRRAANGDADDSSGDHAGTETLEAKSRRETSGTEAVDTPTPKTPDVHGED
ncbi:hypothetical protein OB955_22115 [Halobacteria archaeon AArc-m2/3/4]|uniref:Uncharacterized protein n=1 Tax=Natronoglomus mannanivorans TaxID=2979990 RepID=A0ABT2QKI5_9EURY|nr:hypothetical protein [Halobacteria archaeon AArc-m2/3/4]